MTNKQPALRNIIFLLLFQSGSDYDDKGNYEVEVLKISNQSKTSNDTLWSTATRNVKNVNFI